MKIQLPFTKEIIQQFNTGDVLEITGNIYTARDAAHKRMADAIREGKELPIDMKNQTIFYAGPCPAGPGRVIGPVGPTTSARMDPYVEMLLERGLIAMIGKGDRAPYIAPLLKKYKAVYLLGLGGAAAISSKQVKEVEYVAYNDLGTESIKRFYVEDLKVIVGIDANGQILHDEGIAKYRRAK